MKKLHLLVLRSFIGPVILIFFIVLFILLMQFLWRYIDDLVGKGLSFFVIAKLLVYTSSSLVPMALPLSILMASLMTFGNMGEYYELTAIKASGISLQRVMMPLAILVLFMSVGAFFFANDVLPYSNLKMRALLYDVRRKRPDIQIIPGSFYDGIEGYSIRVNKKDPTTNMLYGIKIYDHTQNRGNISVSLADSGKMIVTKDNRDLIFTLYHGRRYDELQSSQGYKRVKTYPEQYETFDKYRFVINLIGFHLDRTNENLFRNHEQMMDLKQLSHMADSLKKEISIRKSIILRTLFNGNFFRKRNYMTRAERSRFLFQREREREREIESRQKKEGKPVVPINPRRIPRPVNSRAASKAVSPGKVPRSVNPKATSKAINSGKVPRSVNPKATSKTVNSGKVPRSVNPKATSKTVNSRKVPRPVNLKATSKDFSPGKVPKKAGTYHRNPPEVIRKSIIPAGPEYCDSLLSLLTFQEKKRIYDEALGFARQTRSYLLGSSQSLDSRIRSLRRYQVEWQRKFTIAFACFVFLLIGAPLGAIIRKGGLGLPLVLSTIFFIFFYILSLMGEKFVRQSLLPDYIGMWMASGVFFVAGIFLTYKATTDASMLNFDTYANFFKKLFGIKRYSIIDIVEPEVVTVTDKHAKTENLVSSLGAFLESISEQLTQVNNRISPSGFLLSITGMRETTNLMLFERLYKNIARSIIQSDFYDERSFRAKMLEFPDFNYSNYLDLGWRLYVKLVLLCIPPITFIVIIRHYIQLLSLKGRLNTIYRLSEEVSTMIRQLDTFNK